MKEVKDSGSIGLQDIRNLLSFSVGNWGIFFYLFCASSAAAFQLYTTYWISVWTEQDTDEQRKTKYIQVLAGLLVTYMALNFMR